MRPQAIFDRNTDSPGHALLQGLDWVCGSLRLTGSHNSLPTVFACQKKQGISCLSRGSIHKPQALSHSQSPMYRPGQHDVMSLSSSYSIIEAKL